MKPGGHTSQGGRILGLQTREGLVWTGEDVVTIAWDVRRVPIDEHGSTATVHGYCLQMHDGTTRFIAGHKILRIFRAGAVNAETAGSSE
jgi:hypothetical protein